MSVCLDIPRPRTGALAAAALLLSAVGSLAIAQGRNRAYIRGPSSPSGTGNSVLVRLPAGPGDSAYGGSAGPLQGGQGSFGVRRPGLPLSPVRAVSASSITRMAYRPLPACPFDLSQSPAEVRALDLVPRLRSVLLIGDDTADDPSASCLQAGHEANSLVPAGAGMFSKHMSDGQAALQAGGYIKAWGDFRMANIVQPRLAEAPVGMALAKLASAACSYSSAAIDFQEALRLMPSLPLVRLRPAGLLGQEAFATAVGRLERHLESDANDAEALLVLGLLRAFDGTTDQAKALLTRADQARRKYLTDDRLDADPVLAAVRTAQEALRTTTDAEEQRPREEER